MDESRRVPLVDRVLQQFSDLIEGCGRQPVTGCVRADLAAASEGAKHSLSLPDAAALFAGGAPDIAATIVNNDAAAVLLTRPLADIEALAARLCPAVQAAFGAQATVTVEPCSSQIGSGALPVERLPSAALVVRPHFKKAGKFLSTVEAAFRGLPVPVICHIRDDAYRLDLRCLEAQDEARFVAQLAQVKL